MIEVGVEQVLDEFRLEKGLRKYNVVPTSLMDFRTLRSVCSIDTIGKIILALEQAPRNQFPFITPLSYEEKRRIIKILNTGLDE